MRIFSCIVAFVSFLVVLIFGLAGVFAIIDRKYSAACLSVVLTSLAFAIFFNFYKECKEGVEEEDIF